MSMSPSGASHARYPSGSATVADSATRRQSGTDPLEPRHAQAEQVAALAGREGVDFVDDDRLESFEHREAVGIAQQERQRFGRRQQDLRGLDPRCRALRSEGVSPVRVSTRIDRPISSRGVTRLRWISTASAFSGRCRACGDRHEGARSGRRASAGTPRASCPRRSSRRAARGAPPARCRASRADDGGVPNRASRTSR